MNRMTGRIRALSGGLLAGAVMLMLGALLVPMPGAAANPAPSQVRLDAAVDRPVLPAGGKQTVFLRVGLTGFPLESDADRAPLNVAIVLDKSGSMSGDKIARAREAAIEAIERLSPRDIVSVVTYDDNVRVVVPATKASEATANPAMSRNRNPPNSRRAIAPPISAMVIPPRYPDPGMRNNPRLRSIVRTRLDRV